VGEDHLEVEEDHQEEEDRNTYSQYRLSNPNNQYNSSTEEATADWRGENQTYILEIGRRRATGCINGASFAIQICIKRICAYQCNVLPLP